jgi:hypothetical protein
VAFAGKTGIDGRMQQAFPPKTKHVVVCEPKIQEVKEDEPSKKGDEEEEDVYAVIKKAVSFLRTDVALDRFEY